MKARILKRITSAAAAMAVATAGLGAFAAEDDAQVIQINKPYLNLTVKADDTLEELPEDLEFTLTDADGKVYAQWKAGEEAEAATADGIYNITGNTQLTGLPVDPFVPDIKTDDGSMYLGYSSVSPEEDGYHLELNKEYTYYYTPEADITQIPGATGETMTLEAGKWAAVVDGAFADGKASSGMYVGGFELMFNDHSGGVVTNDNLEAGDHEVMTRTKWSHGWSGGSGGTLSISDKDTTYIKVTGNISEISNGYFNEDGTFTHTHSADDATHYMRLGELYASGEDGVDRDHYIVAYFISGGVVTAALPDENGNVSVWVSADTLTYGLATEIICDSGSGGGGRNGTTVKNLNPRRTSCTYSTEFALPEAGLTLYDLPASDYTVTVDSTEYEIENGTITVTDSKDLQGAEIVVKAVEVEPEPEEPAPEQPAEPEDPDPAEPEQPEDTDPEEPEEPEDTDPEEPEEPEDTDSEEPEEPEDTDPEEPEEPEDTDPGQSGEEEKSAGDANPGTGAAVSGASLIAIAAAALAIGKEKK